MVLFFFSFNLQPRPLTPSSPPFFLPQPLLSDIEAIPPFAFFSKDNEMKIGRVAMLGFVGLVIVEQVAKGGSALFGF